jgi:hypothetical protein
MLCKGHSVIGAETWQRSSRRSRKGSVGLWRGEAQSASGGPVEMKEQAGKRDRKR